MWSDNVGFIAMEGLYLDITPPSASNFSVFTASGSKAFTLASTDESPVVSGVGLYEFKISDWNNDATQYGTTTGSVSPSFTHDFRQAKSYSLKITDPFGNSSEGTVQVVADVPADTIILPIDGFIAGGSATTYTSTFADSKVADAVQKHSLMIALRDQYGNVVKNESTNDTAEAIKTVNVRVAFNNNVDINQIDLLALNGSNSNI
jgi:hypothetical protein